MTYINETPDNIIKFARNQGYWFQRNVKLTREDFFLFSKKLSIPWSESLHNLHGEKLENDGIVNWSNYTDLKSSSIPWHADNPWHSIYRFPLRVFYAEKIPDPEDGNLCFLNITDWFQELPEYRKKYFRSLRVLTQDYKKKCQPFWSNFIKIHPITKKESFYWGAMRVDGNVFGLQPDEGVPFPRFSFTMAIEKPNRDLILDNEICDWFSEILDNKKYLYVHKWNVGDFLILDNWVSLHYRKKIVNENERLLWRKSLCQPWQILS